MLPLHVDACSELRGVFAFVVKVIDKDTSDSSKDQLVIFIIETSVIHESNLGHVNRLDKVEEFV